MKTLLSLTTVIFILSTSLSWAKHEGHTHDYEGLPSKKQAQEINQTGCKNMINVSVNGLVCDFCARALEKVFGKRNDIVGIDVDLNNGKVRIAMKENKTIDDTTLTQLITDSGYNVVAIKKGC